MTPSPPAAGRPLIIRLRNWVGDVTLGVPTLQRLSDAGFNLHLIGKGWAADLLAGHGWPVHPLAPGWRARLQQLRALRGQARAIDPGFDRRANALCFPYSFSSALDFRLAGLHALGYAHEGRSWLLHRHWPRPRGVHELEVYWRLGSAFLGHEAPLPASIGLRLSATHRAQARALRQRHALADGFVVACPFAGGTWSGQDKTWPGFPVLVRRLLAAGLQVVVCPGPGEEATARKDFPGALCLEGVGLGAYAALLAEAGVMVSNDTGPGHLAAAVGAPLLSVLGPSDPALWRAWGPSVHIVQGNGGWPSVDDVAAALTAVRRARGPTPPASSQGS